MTDNSIRKREIEDRYQNAQKIIQGYLTKKAARNSALYPTWVGDTDCFWYVNDLKSGGKEFRFVNAKSAICEPAFDHEGLANALSIKTNMTVNSSDLPIEGLQLDSKSNVIHFEGFGKHWKYEPDKNLCEEVPKLNEMEEVVSPNGKYLVYGKEHNLWLRDLQSGSENALTIDGSEDFSYAQPSTAWGFAQAADLQVRWSPDSRRIFTVQRDRRGVETLPVVEHVPADGNFRPRVSLHKVAYPGDENIETLRLLIVDVSNGEQTDIDYSQIPVTRNNWGYFSASLGWWNRDSRYAYFVDVDRYYKCAKVIVCDTLTGKTKELFEERSNTNVCLMNNGDMWPYFLPLPETNELLWYSERSGWAHLYLYDLTSGNLKHAVTTGDWLVRDVVSFVSSRREIFVQTGERCSGRNPYYRDLIRVNIDTGEQFIIESGDYDCFVSAYTDMVGLLSGADRLSPNSRGVSPTGNYTVVTRGRVDAPSEHVLIDSGGVEVLKLGTAELDDMPDGWRWPEPVKLVASDGITETYGVVYRPSDFSPEKSYPVINDVFSTPDFPWAPVGSFSNSLFDGLAFFNAAAIAELGFIVVQIEGRGASFRSKAFKDADYGNLQLPTMLADQVAGLNQLAKRHPFMDIGRVAIHEFQGGPAVLHSMVDYPELYRVGVSNWPHDARLMGASMWSDMLEGPIKPSEMYPEDKLENLKGKLLLMNGMMDICTPPAGIFRLVDALQKANKDFDMLLLPKLGHDFSGYVVRRAWDYMVEHLLEEMPPKNFLVELYWDHITQND